MIFRITGLLCFAVVLLAQSALDRAWQLTANGRQPEAIQILQPLVQREPTNVDARLLLGSLLMDAGQGKESIEQLSAAVKLRPQSFEAQNALGEAYSKFGDLESARVAFEEAISLKPDYGIAHLNLAQALIAVGQWDAAAEHLEKAIPLLNGSDEGADAHYLRAKLYTAKSEPDAACKQLEQAVSIRPKFAEAWADLGQCRKTLQDDAGTLAAFQQAVASNPGDAIAEYRLGAEYLAQNKPHKAIEFLQKAQQLNPTDQSILNALQKALRQDGRPEEAAHVKQQLAELLRDKDTVNQNHLTAIRLNNEGAALEKAGDLHGALAKYAQAAELYPDHGGIHLNYGVALLRVGQWTAGLEQLHGALQQDPKNDKLRATLKDALAQAPPNSIPKWRDTEAP